MTTTPPADPAGLPAQALPAATVALARPSRRLLLGLAAFVLVFGAVGYAWRGNPAGWQAGPADSAANAPHSQGAAQFEAMAAKLAERLQREPGDAEGWSMLGRSYTVLGQPAQALAAFQRVVALRPDDAQALADLADAMGSAQDRRLAGEPERLVARALQLDPDNVKALALAGTIAYDRGDKALAAQHWARALQQVEPGSAIAQRLQGALADAQGAGTGQPATELAVAPVRASAPAMPPASPAAAASSVQARITLAPALAGRAGPEATVFIFARAVPADGQAAGAPRAPLAILRRQVKELPLEVMLDDSLAMSPALRLSGARQVVVGARISTSGNAMPQPGDFQGLSAPVAVGARGVAVTISDELR